jgi:hypothetical protein
MFTDFCGRGKCLRRYTMTPEKHAPEFAAGSWAGEYFLLPSSRSESTGIRSVDDEAGDNEA